MFSSSEELDFKQHHVYHLPLPNHQQQSWHELANLGRSSQIFIMRVKFFSSRTQAKIFGSAGEKRKFSIIGGLSQPRKPPIGPALINNMFIIYHHLIIDNSMLMIYHDLIINMFMIYHHLIINNNMFIIYQYLIINNRAGPS